MKSAGVLLFQMLCITPAICGALAEMDSSLRAQAMEHTHAYGATVDGKLVEVKHRGKDGSWSIVRYDPVSGVACLLAAGHNWMHSSPPEARGGR